MANRFAKAFPRKRLFIDMFIRDISFEDCILDLIDNSIDGFVRSRNINIARSLSDLVVASAEPEDHQHIAHVDVKYNDRELSISDNCGGIPRRMAEDDIFNFGHGANETEDRATLGVYGIGMKRALFKVGRHFKIESRTTTDGFVVESDLDEWIRNDESLDDWRFPLKYINRDSEGEGYTHIRISKVRPEIKQRLKDHTFQKLLYKLISQTYGLFLERYVRITINGEVVQPTFIPIGESDKVSVGMKRYQQDGVSVQIFAGLAERTDRGEWKAENAGWYVACNGRMVVFADKTELTGWTTMLPTYVSKYRGFVGIIFFQSSDPLKLPWTTTKRGINRESEIFLDARAEMFSLSKPVLSFLDRMYSSDQPEERATRRIAGDVKRLDIRSLSKKSESAFSARIPDSKRGTLVRVQYDADREMVKQIAAHIKKPTWGANKVGEHTFNYFVKAEGLA